MKWPNGKKESGKGGKGGKEEEGQGKGKKRDKGLGLGFLQTPRNPSSNPNPNLAKRGDVTFQWLPLGVGKVTLGASGVTPQLPFHSFSQDQTFGKSSAEIRHTLTTVSL